MNACKLWNRKINFITIIANYINLHFIFYIYSYTGISMTTRHYVTKEAFDELDREIKYLEDEVLPPVVNEVSTARGNGDLSENAEYHAAKNKQREILRKIGYLKDVKVNAEVVDCSILSCDSVKFGLFVEILDLDTNKQKKIRLVGDYEADINKNLISIEAPLGKVLLGKKVGETVDFESGNNIFSYQILSISKN